MNKFKRTTTINKILSLKRRVKGIQGGTSSGKTFGILPILINKAIKSPFLETSVVAESVPHLRRGVIKDFKKIMVSTNRWNRSQWHSTTSTYTFSNGSTIEFFSADDDSKLRGARRDVLYINEANNISFEAYQELSVRTKKDVYLDWNPTSEFWFHEHLQNDKDVDFLTVTYLDNEACPQSAIDYILKAKEKALTSKYWENWYRVYGLGLIGFLEGTVFENWQEGEFDDSLTYVYGMDFGFSPDPTTLIKVAIDHKNKLIYIKEFLYATGLSNSDIIEVCHENIKGNDLLIADCAEKREISEIRRSGINCIRSRKGKDSVRTGIKKMMDYKIIVDPKSENVKKELRNYLWNDKTAGIPKKGNDHCFVGETDILTNKGIKRIDNIKVGDFVANSFGFNKVVKVWENGYKNTSLFSMQFATFSVSLRCTPNHKIKTTDGWIEIQNLNTDHNIYLNKFLTEKHTTYIKEKTTTHQVTKGCTGLCGSFITEKSQKATIFIILMLIRVITGLKTYSLLRGQSTSQWRVERGLMKIKNGLMISTLKVLKRLKNGIDQKRVSNGTKNRELKLGLIESIERLNVKSAGKSTKLDTLGYLNTVTTTARLERIEEREKSVEKVYDIMVEENHEYTANGVIVHNCIDPTRYCFDYLINI